MTEHLALAREMVQARKHFMKRIRLLRKHKIYRQRKGDHRVFMLFLPYWYVLILQEKKKRNGI